MHTDSLHNAVTTSAGSETPAQSTPETIPQRDKILSATNPPLIEIREEEIPTELKLLSQWMCWKWVWTGKKWNKPPCQPNGAPASTTDAMTWVTFEEALQAHRSRGLGIGFVLTGDGIVGIDLDNCRNPETGVIAGWAREIIETLASYAEISPTGTGVKILLHGELPEHFGKQFNRPDRAGQVEVYSRGRYFTITGQHLAETPPGLCVNPDGLRTICRQVGSWKNRRTVAVSPAEPYPVPKINGDGPIGDDDRDTALAALSVLDPDTSYEDWIKIGMALHSVDPSGDMLAEWDEWSTGSGKYLPGEPAAKWNSFQGGGVGIGTLIHLANQTGHSWRSQRPSEDLDDRRRRQKFECNGENEASVTVTTPLKPEPFPIQAIPPGLRRYAESAAAAIGCDPAMIAGPLLVLAGAAIGTTRKIQVKRGWEEFPIIWLVVLAESGSQKSPALDAALRPVSDRQTRLMKEYQDSVAAHELALVHYERAIKEWKASESACYPPERPQFPLAPRLLISDATVEAAFPILAENPRGVVLFKDELSIWLSSFDRYDKAGGGLGTAAKWLECFGGRPVSIDRRSGEPKLLFIPCAAVSVTGGCQPAIYARLMRPDFVDNGLAPRLLPIHARKMRRRWTEAELDPSEVADLKQLFERLYDLKTETDPQSGEQQPRIIRMSSAAKHLWVEFYNRHADEQISLDQELGSTWSKLEGYVPRFALIHHLVRVAADDVSIHNPDDVDVDSMQAAITLVGWFASEAKRLHEMHFECDEERDRRELVDFIRTTGGRITVRDLMRGPRKFRVPAEEARALLHSLVKAGLGEWDTTPTGGHPLEVFRLAQPSALTEILEQSGDLDSVNVGADHQECERRPRAQLTEELLEEIFRAFPINSDERPEAGGASR